MMYVLFGWIASSITVIASLPQAIKTLKTKSVSDLSRSMWILHTTASFSWAIYAYGGRDNILLIANIITFAVNGSVLYMKIRYDLQK